MNQRRRKDKTAPIRRALFWPVLLFYLLFPALSIWGRSGEDQSERPKIGRGETFDRQMKASKTLPFDSSWFLNSSTNSAKEGQGPGDKDFPRIDPTLEGDLGILDIVSNLSIGSSESPSLGGGSFAPPGHGGTPPGLNPGFTSPGQGSTPPGLNQGGS